MSRRSLFCVVPILGLIVVSGIWAWSSRSDETEPMSPSFVAVIAADVEFDACLECHDDLDAGIVAGAVQLIGFAHQDHFSTSGDVGCGNCHGLDTHDRTPPRVPEMGDCFSCHVDDGSARELTCLECHASQTVPPPQSHFVPDWSEVHRSAAQINQSQCEICHSREAFCTACHGTNIPHQEGWSGYPHARATFDAGIESCARCHPRGAELTTRDECDTCHHPQEPTVPIWMRVHPEVVKAEGGATCFECHDPTTCATCHTTGIEDFSADLRRLEAPEAEQTRETDSNE